MIPCAPLQSHLRVLKRSAFIMRKHILYAYAEGSDLVPIADRVVEWLSEFISHRAWISGDCWVVNQTKELGLNLELPDPKQEPDGWFADVEEIAITCNNLARTIHRSFVIGIADHQAKITDDLQFLDGGAIDIERLQSIIGTSPPDS